MAMKIGAARCATFFGVRGPGQKMGLFSCDFAEPFFEVFSTVIFFLRGPRRAYACVVVVRNLDF